MNSEEKTSSMDEQSQNPKNKKCGPLILYFLFVVLMLSGGVYVIWLKWYANYEVTENAYVSGDLVILTSQQAGRVISYTVNDTDYVEAGQVLVVLDSTDYLLAFDEAKENLRMAARHVSYLYQDVQQKKAEVILQKAKFERASLDFENRKMLIESEAISVEEYEHVQAEFKIARSALEVAIHQLKAAEISLGTQPLQNHPDIESAKLKAIEAYIAVKRCLVLAPVSGYIAKRNIQLGQSVNPLSPLLNIVPLDNVWVDANFKEVQLTYVRIGQPVHLTADIYGREVKFKGEVCGIWPGSGSTFSLLPPQNASGNWIKIVQRVPVRISLDLKQLKEHPLIVGLSMKATIDISNTEGPMLAKHPVTTPVTTNICNFPLDEVKEELDRIVEENLKLSTLGI